VSSSTVSLNASDGEWPFYEGRHTGLHDPGQGAHKHAALAVRSLYTSFWNVVGKGSPIPRRFPPPGSVPRPAPLRLEHRKARVDARARQELRRTDVPLPFGATMITSTFFGGTTLVWSL